MEKDRQVLSAREANRKSGGLKTGIISLFRRAKDGTAHKLVRRTGEDKKRDLDTQMGSERDRARRTGRSSFRRNRIGSAEKINGRGSKERIEARGSKERIEVRGSRERIEVRGSRERIEARGSRERFHAIQSNSGKRRKPSKFALGAKKPSRSPPPRHEPSIMPTTFEEVNTPMQPAKTRMKCREKDEKDDDMTPTEFVRIAAPLRPANPDAKIKVPVPKAIMCAVITEDDGPAILVKSPLTQNADAIDTPEIVNVVPDLPAEPVITPVIIAATPILPPSPGSPPTNQAVPTLPSPPSPTNEQAVPNLSGPIAINPETPAQQASPISKPKPGSLQSTPPAAKLQPTNIEPNLPITNQETTVKEDAGFSQSPAPSYVYEMTYSLDRNGNLIPRWVPVRQKNPPVNLNEQDPAQPQLNEPEAKESEEMRPEQKNPIAEPKMLEPNKANLKMPELKNSDPKVTELKKSEKKVPEMKKSQPKVPELKKSEPKVAERKKSEPRVSGQEKPGKKAKLEEEDPPKSAYFQMFQYTR
ncbi:hypothetical protein QR680_018557 [Steinernema hermaphroditum]|uniref:Uncharacterized protein n=1 Tax=Steinernema hermaphroditum TaxID=289476 RepID=A0AA39HKK1_9BILA|nr:hypothetical protein QR680_018557 [Steinernema hermaphroditum]